jgi:hypothetical protein
VSRKKKASNPTFATKPLLLLQNIPLLLLCSKNGSSIEQMKNNKLAGDFAGDLAAKTLL